MDDYGACGTVFFCFVNLKKEKFDRDDALCSVNTRDAHRSLLELNISVVTSCLAAVFYSAYIISSIETEGL